VQKRFFTSVNTASMDESSGFWSLIHETLLTVFSQKYSLQQEGS